MRTANPNNIVYRAADFGAYGFEVRKLDRALYRVVTVVRRPHHEDLVIIMTHETALSRAQGTANGMREVVHHLGTAPLDAYVGTLADKKVDTV